MSLWTWLGKLFTNIKKEWAAIAVSVLVQLETALQSGGLLSVLAGVISPKLGPAVVALLNKEIPNLIATLLAIEGLPADPTPAQILTFENNVVAAFGALNDKSQFKTTLVAQIYGIIQAQIGTGAKPTFAQLVTDVEEAWQDYQTDLANEAAASADTSSTATT
jgi:hypothetical protein